MAARFLVAGGNGNWTSTTNWSATSGGSSGASAPTVSDDVTFDSNSGSTNITTDTSGRAALSFSVTSGYTGTLTMTNQLTVSGNVTLGANMTIAGSGTLAINAASTMTSNGKTWPNALTLTGSVTFTLADNWNVTGLVTCGGTTNNTVVNGSQFNCSGGFRFGGTSGNVTGTTLVNLIATGTVDAPSLTGAGRMLLPITINTSGTITVNSPFTGNIGLLNYVSGTVITNATWATTSGGMSRSRTT